jgi:hypothetical protein
MSKMSGITEKKKVKDNGDSGPNDNSLFDNSMVRSALAAMSPEQKQHYKEIGEKMYNSINFKDSEVLNTAPEPMAEAAAYVIEGLKSGLHPSHLDENEVALMKDLYGEKWYEKWDATEEEMRTILVIEDLNEKD